ncbi:ribosome silencing factor [Pseudomonas sp. P1B16]|uniref:Ribosomal silencing factor RsfS n=1 Tax=Pseudomonas capeferrum TaxID=1495066 RepID=A0ABY7R7D4_9PSED|nr:MULTISPECIES: ribosome silencing factor [Pseudomonas]KEY85804.1 ribosome-associated protein IOJAP [Pseudomonas capeferrum]KGI93885.1 ribosome-associated protein IOJAP [Pseudomonas sp. H2]MCH7298626.1 ribosome silencing factor [Pseudomonas capeferrum]MDD2061962.1 ribosome silencing factor [Pseudomonas sp. 25571]MDD2128281.1 ribosome silencing factor [Pseudomonas sp. 17391]
MNKQKIHGEDLVKLTISALEDVKAQDIQVIDVREKHSLTDYMIIATGTSNRQINAMLEKVREAVKKQGAQPLGEEGKGDSDWVLLDLNDVIVHMMTAAARQFYDLERLWAGAEQSRAVDAKHHSPENVSAYFDDKIKDRE